VHIRIFFTCILIQMYTLHSAEELHKVTHVRLDREHIGSLDNLLLFSTNVTNVYLQHVCIAVSLWIGITLFRHIVNNFLNRAECIM